MTVLTTWHHVLTVDHAAIATAAPSVSATWLFRHGRTIGQLTMQQRQHVADPVNRRSITHNESPAKGLKTAPLRYAVYQCYCGTAVSLTQGH